MAVSPPKPDKTRTEPYEVVTKQYLTFHLCPAPATPRSKILGTVVVEVVNDPAIDDPAAIGIAVYDKDGTPVVAVTPGNIALALAAIAQIVEAYGGDVVELSRQAHDTYEVI